MRRIIIFLLVMIGIILYATYVNNGHPTEFMKSEFNRSYEDECPYCNKHVSEDDWKYHMMKEYEKAKEKYAWEELEHPDPILH